MTRVMSCIGRAIGMSVLGLAVAAPSALVAQDSRYEVGAGFGVSGPARAYAEYLVLHGAVRVAQAGPWRAAIEGGAMIGGARDGVPCIEAITLAGPVTPGVGGGNAGSDCRDLGHVGRLGVTGRFAPRAGIMPYVMATAGVWASAWTRGDLAGTSRAQPFGPLLEAGIGVPLPNTDQRTVLELRYGLFGQVETGGFLPARGAGLRLTLNRRW